MTIGFSIAVRAPNLAGIPAGVRREMAAIDPSVPFYDVKTLEEALAAVPPELIGYGLLYGTPEQVVGKLRAYGEVGVRHVVLVPVSAIFSRRASIYGLWAIRKIARWLRNAV